MLFSSLIFIYAFLPTVAILYFIPWNLKIKNFILLIFSLIFYAWGEPIFVLIMIASIIANWFFGLLVDKYRGTNKAKISMFLACVFNLGMLFIYKYLGFTTSLLSKIIPMKIIRITLPIGISFFTFQAMSYVIDVYRNDAKVQKSLFDVGLFVSFFPQLIAGPIVRYNTIAEEINYREHHIPEMAAGFKRFLVGLFKKILLANSLAVVADQAFGQISTLSTSMAWFGIIAYSFQIFYDFSGYSDMAIGLAKVFGFNLEENFNYPYISKSVSEFWRRWHISLGTWFKDYLYFPLGGSRVETKGKLVRNLFIVWFLTGVWHGANTTFVLWGLLYFVILTFEKLTGIPRKFKNKFAILAYRIFTLLLVVLGWVIFRANTVSDAGLYISKMFSFNNIISDNFLFYFHEYRWVLLFAFIVAVPVAPYLKGKIEKNTSLFAAYSVVELVVFIALFLLCTAALVVGTHNPFIYFQF